MTAILGRDHQQPIIFEHTLNRFHQTYTHASYSATKPSLSLNNPPYLLKNINCSARKQHIGQLELNSNTFTESYVDTAATATSTITPNIANICDSQASCIIPIDSLPVSSLPSTYTNVPSSVYSNYLSAQASYNAIRQAFTTARSDDITGQKKNTNSPSQLVL